MTSKMSKISKSLKPKDIIRILCIALLAAVVGMNVYTLNAARLMGNAVPMPLGFGASVVLSGSMEPELSVGDLLIIVPREDYEIGDVIVYQVGRSSVVHRIIAIEGDEVITQGDANNAPDDAILHSNIKGEVAFAIPLIGHLIYLIKTPIATIALLILAVFFLERSFRNDKKADQDTAESLRREIERLKKEQNK